MLMFYILNNVGWNWNGQEYDPCWGFRCSRCTNLDCPHYRTAGQEKRENEAQQKKKAQKSF